MDCPARDGTGGLQVGFLSKDQSFEALLLGLEWVFPNYGTKRYKVIR